jgi:hypothetical protein
MRLEDVAPAPHAEDWVLAAFAKRSKVGGGTFLLVLGAEGAGYVVKLTRSEVDFLTLVHFAGTNPHFPIVVKYAVDQGQDEDGSFHAIMMEHLPDTYPLAAATVADYINRIDGFKTHPVGVLKAVHRMRQGEIAGYPESLALAMEALGKYAIQHKLLVELNQRSNWGQRADGTLVLLDLVHSRQEM